MSRKNRAHETHEIHELGVPNLFGITFNKLRIPDDFEKSIIFCTI